MILLVVIVYCRRSDSSRQHISLVFHSGSLAIYCDLIKSTELLPLVRMCRPFHLVSSQSGLVFVCVCVCGC